MFQLLFANNHSIVCVIKEFSNGGSTGFQSNARWRYLWCLCSQIKQKLKDHGMEKDTTLTWRVQPDGNMFAPKWEENSIGRSFNSDYSFIKWILMRDFNINFWQHLEVRNRLLLQHLLAYKFTAHISFFFSLLHYCIYIDRWHICM